MVEASKKNVENLDYWVYPNGRVNVRHRFTNEAFSVSEEEAVNLIKSGYYNPLTLEEASEEKRRVEDEKLENLSDSPTAAAVRGVLSAATGGLFDVYTQYSPLEKWATKRRTQAEINAANAQYADAIASGDALKIQDAEDRLYYARMSHEGSQKMIEERDQGIRRHTQELIQKNPVSSFAGEVVGTLLPVGAVATAGRAAMKGTLSLAEKIALSNMKKAALKKATKEVGEETAELATRGIKEVVEELAMRKTAKSLATDGIATFAGKRAKQAAAASRILAEGAAIGVQQELAHQSREGKGFSAKDLALSATIGAGIAGGAGLAGLALKKSAGYAYNKAATYLKKKAGVTEAQLDTLLSDRQLTKTVLKEVDGLAAKDPELAASWSNLKRTFDEKVYHSAYKKAVETYSNLGGRLGGMTDDDIVNAIIRNMTPEEKVAFAKSAEVSKTLLKKHDYPTSFEDPLDMLVADSRARNNLLKYQRDIKSAIPIIGADKIAGLPKWLVFGGAGYAVSGDPYTGLMMAAAPWALTQAVVKGSSLAKWHPKLHKTFSYAFNLGGKTLKAAAPLGGLKILNDEQYQKTLDIIDSFGDNIIFEAAFENAVAHGMDARVAAEIAARQVKAFDYLKDNTGSKESLRHALNVYLDPRQVIRGIYNGDLDKYQKQYLNQVHPEIVSALRREANALIREDRLGNIKLSTKSKNFLKKILGSDNKTLLYQQIAHGKQAPEGPKSKKKMRGAKATTTPLQSASKNLGG